MNKPAAPSVAPRVTKSTITFQSKVGKFRKGDTFKPWGVENIGYITSVSDRAVRFYYEHSPEVTHEAAPSELRRIIGIKK